MRELEIDEIDTKVIIKLVKDTTDLFEEHKDDYKIKTDRMEVLRGVICQLYKGFKIDKVTCSLVGYDMVIDSDGNIKFGNENNNEINKIYWFDKEKPIEGCLDKLTAYINNLGIKGECEIIESVSVEYNMLNKFVLATAFPIYRIEEAIANINRADFTFVIRNNDIFIINAVN